MIYNWKIFKKLIYAVFVIEKFEEKNQTFINH